MWKRVVALNDSVRWPGVCSCRGLWYTMHGVNRDSLRFPVLMSNCPPILISCPIVVHRGKRTQARAPIPKRKRLSGSLLQKCWSKPQFPGVVRGLHRTYWHRTSWATACKALTDVFQCWDKKFWWFSCSTPMCLLTVWWFSRFTPIRLLAVWFLFNPCVLWDRCTNRRSQKHPQRIHRCPTGLTNGLWCCVSTLLYIDATCVGFPTADRMNILRRHLGFSWSPSIILV